MGRYYNVLCDILLGGIYKDSFVCDDRLTLVNTDTLNKHFNWDNKALMKDYLQEPTNSGYLSTTEYSNFYNIIKDIQVREVFATYAIITNRKSGVKRHSELIKSLIGIPTDPATSAIKNAILDNMNEELKLFVVNMKKYKESFDAEIEAFHNMIATKINTGLNNKLNELVDKYKQQFESGILDKESFTKFVTQSYTEKRMKTISQIYYTTPF